MEFYSMSVLVFSTEKNYAIKIHVQEVLIDPIKYGFLSVYTLEYEYVVSAPFSVCNFKKNVYFL